MVLRGAVLRRARTGVPGDDAEPTPARPGTVLPASATVSATVSAVLTPRALRVGYRTRGTDRAYGAMAPSVSGTGRTVVTCCMVLRLERSPRVDPLQEHRPGPKRPLFALMWSTELGYGGTAVEY
eukprot:785360-Rhodomonas_salina.1